MGRDSLLHHVIMCKLRLAYNVCISYQSCNSTRPLCARETSNHQHIWKFSFDRSLLTNKAQRQSAYCLQTSFPTTADYQKHSICQHTGVIGKKVTDTVGTCASLIMAQTSITPSHHSGSTAQQKLGSQKQKFKASQGRLLHRRLSSTHHASGRFLSTSR